MGKKRIAIFASGTGSNAVNLIRSFRDHPDLEVAFVLSNNPNARVLVSAVALNVQTYCLTNAEVAAADVLLDLCEKEAIDWIVLAGYLRKVPEAVIRQFPEKIINLHPSLLPDYGGKGMYGENVHKAVLLNKEPESGITVHFVNEEFDKGRIIAQFRCKVTSEDTLASLSSKIHHLEQSYLPAVVECTILNKIDHGDISQRV